MIYHIRLCFLRRFYHLQNFFPALLFYRFFAAQFVRGATSRAANFTLEDFNDFCCSFTAKRDATIMIGKLNLPGVQQKNCPGQASFNVSLKSNGQNKNKKNPGSWNSQWVTNSTLKWLKFKTMDGVVLVLRAGRIAMEIYQNPPFSRTKKVWIFPARHLSVTKGTTFWVAFLRCRSTAWSTSPRHPSACCQAAWHLGSPPRPKSPEQWKKPGYPNCNPFPFSTQGYPIPFQPHPPTSEKPRCQEIQEASDEVANGPPNQLGHLAEWGHQWWMVMWWLPVSGSQRWFPSHLRMKLWMIINCADADDM